MLGRDDLAKVVAGLDHADTVTRTGPRSAGAVSPPSLSSSSTSHPLLPRESAWGTRGRGFKSHRPDSNSEAICGDLWGLCGDFTLYTPRQPVIYLQFSAR